jgi:hypothetical protein
MNQAVPSWDSGDQTHTTTRQGQRLKAHLAPGG